MPEHLFEDEVRRLGRAWIAAYNRVLFLALALKRLPEPRHRGVIRQEMLSALAAAIDAADILRAFGRTPAGQFAGAERRLWDAALTVERIVSESESVTWSDLSDRTPPEFVLEVFRRGEQAWAEFVGVVASVPDDELVASPALDIRLHNGHGFQQLLGPHRLRATREPLEEDAGHVLGDRAVVGPAAVRELA